MCVTISPNKKQTTFYDLCFIKCGLPVSRVLFIEPGNNIRHPIWCVHISVHWDWFQSSHGDGGYVHPKYVHHPILVIPTQMLSRFSRPETLFGLNTRSSSTSNSFAVRLISLPAINTRLPSQSIRRSPT